jgi:hypothetical protein
MAAGYYTTSIKMLYSFRTDKNGHKDQAPDRFACIRDLLNFPYCRFLIFTAFYTVQFPVIGLMVLSLPSAVRFFGLKLMTLLLRTGIFKIQTEFEKSFIYHI